MTTTLEQKKALRAELRQAWLDEGNSKRITFRNWLEEMAANPRGVFQESARRYVGMLSGSSHTPLPWKMRETYSNGEPQGCVIEPVGYELQTSNNDENYANCKLIVTAVNCHDDLLEALRAAKRMIRELASQAGDLAEALGDQVNDPWNDGGIGYETSCIIDAAISKAEGSAA